MTQAKTPVFEEIELPNGKVARRLCGPSLWDRFDDPEVREELDRLEEECDPFGDYGYFARAFATRDSSAETLRDRPIRFKVRQDLGVEELERLERQRDFRTAIRQALQNDPEIEDAEAFECQYFGRDRNEAIALIFANAASYETEEERREKAKEAIAVQKAILSQ